MRVLHREYGSEKHKKEEKTGVNVKFSEKNLTVEKYDKELGRNISIRLQIWDPAGADAYSSMTN